MNTREQPCPAIALESGSPSILGLTRCWQLSGWSWEMMVSSEKAVSILLMRHSRGAWSMLKEYDLIEWTCNRSSELERLDSFITLVQTDQLQILHVDFSCWQVLFQSARTNQRWQLSSQRSSCWLPLLQSWWGREGRKTRRSAKWQRRRKFIRLSDPHAGSKWEMTAEKLKRQETGENGEVKY